MSIIGPRPALWNQNDLLSYAVALEVSALSVSAAISASALARYWFSSSVFLLLYSVARELSIVLKF